MNWGPTNNVLFRSVSQPLSHLPSPLYHPIGVKDPFLTRVIRGHGREVEAGEQAVSPRSDLRYGVEGSIAGVSEPRIIDDDIEG